VALLIRLTIVDGEVGNLVVALPRSASGLLGALLVERRGCSFVDIDYFFALAGHVRSGSIVNTSNARRRPR